MPLTPTSLSPFGGRTINPNQDNDFLWQSDGTQAAYYIEYAENSEGASASNTDWQSYSTSEHTFLADTFSDNTNYKWRVKIRNSIGQESAFSDWAVFATATQLPLLLIFPVDDYDTVTTLPTYQHLFTSPDHLSQYKYQYLVYTGLIWDGFDALTAAQQEALTWDELELYGGSLIWDSGEVISIEDEVEQPSGFFVAGTYWYKVRVKIWDVAGTLFTSGLRTFYILLESIPQTPTITAAADFTNGQNIITITNPTPDPGQVSASYNRLYRKRLDDTWELIEDNITGGIGYDKTCASRKNEEYAVSAVGTNGIEGGKSASAYSTCTLDSYWITDPVTNDTVKLRIDPQWGAMQSEREREENWGIDEKYPCVNYGSRRFYRGQFKAALEKPDDGTTWPQYITQIRDILDADTKSTLVFRSIDGDIFNVDIHDLEIDPSIDRFQQVRGISFSMVETAEAVSPGTYIYSDPPSPITNYWIIDPDTGKGFELIAGPTWSGLRSERDRAENIGFRQEMPSVNYGSKKALRSGFSGFITRLESGSTSLPELVAQLRELVDGKTKKRLLFKTFSGDQFEIDAYGFSFELWDRFNNARKVSFEFIEIGNEFWPTENQLEEDFEQAAILAAAGEELSLDFTDTGETWTVIAGSWARDTDGLYLSAVDEGWRAVVCKYYSVNCRIYASIKWYEGCGLIFRASDDVDSSGNFYMLVIEDDRLILRKVEEWSSTDIDAYVFTPVTGTTYGLIIELVDDLIKIYMDGEYLFYTEDDFNMTALNHGLFSYGTATTNRWANFEVFDVFGDLWLSQLPGNLYNAQLSENYARSGDKSLRIELCRDDEEVSNGKRAELEIKTKEDPLEEHWYFFSVYLPDGGGEDFVQDTGDGDDIIAQWHNTPDDSEEWTMPPLSLHVSGLDGHYYLYRIWDEDELTTDEKLIAEDKIETIDLGDYLRDKGNWVDWMFHVKWGWMESQNPILEVYKDGVLICEKNGYPNTTNDQVGIGFQFGIYKWQWGQPSYGSSIVTKRIIYYDAIKIK